MFENDTTIKGGPHSPILIKNLNNSSEVGALIDQMIAGLHRCCAILLKAEQPIPMEKQVVLERYKDETQIGDIMRVITKDLSEPYSIYTYRYFINNWPELCILAREINSTEYIGVVICKLDEDANGYVRGYIAMLAVDSGYRNMGIGTRLVQSAIDVMREKGCCEVSLETEVTNKNSANLYTRLGFIREKRLFRYYLNGVDAFRLKLLFDSVQ